MSIPVLKVPTYKMTLPISKEEHEFRPFLVKEEKVLLMAKESEDPVETFAAFNDIIKSCTFGKFDPKKYSSVDMEYAFLQIRGKSIGEDIELNLICPDKECKKKTFVRLNINDFEVEHDETIKNIVELDDGISVSLRYPGIEEIGKILKDQSEETIIKVIAECVDYIYNQEERVEITENDYEEVLQFINNLTLQNFYKFTVFYKNIPKYKKDIILDCNFCGKQSKVTVDGITSFFV